GLGVRGRCVLGRLPRLLDQPLAVMEHGFEFVEGAEMVARLGGVPADWDAFAASWGELHLDTYMADGGRYRRRRHALYAATPDGITRKPHAPHFQALDYNRLHGGIDRWFEPITDAIGASHSMT